MKFLLSTLLFNQILSTKLDSQTFYNEHVTYMRNIHHDNKLFQAYEAKYMINLTNKQKTVLRKNVSKISKHNSDKSNTWTMGINQFAHLTDDEFIEQYLMAPQHCSATKNADLSALHSHYNLSNLTLPEQVDWRKKGNFVTPVKNQGQCGSCYAFSSTGALESAWAIHHKELYSLSEQQLMDCSANFDNHGCHGGLPSHSFEYVKNVGGIDTEEVYKYRADEKEACSYNDELKSHVKSLGSFNITQGSEDELAQAVAYFNPVSIAYEVVADFRHYKYGIYKSKDCKSNPEDLNHAVLAVGYGSSAAGDYWIIKNSWGLDFGYSGYFMMQKGTNMCGIATCASFPVV